MATKLHPHIGGFNPSAHCCCTRMLHQIIQGSEANIIFSFTCLFPWEKWVALLFLLHVILRAPIILIIRITIFILRLVKGNGITTAFPLVRMLGVSSGGMRLSTHRTTVPTVHSQRGYCSTGNRITISVLLIHLHYLDLEVFTILNSIVNL